MTFLPLMKSIFTYLLFFFLFLFALVHGIGSVKGYITDFSIMEDAEGIEMSDEFGITGPDELCLYYGSIIGDYFGGGLESDVFSWRIFRENGTLVTEREGGFQVFSYTFSEVGTYKIQLNIRRGTTPVYSGEKSVTINKGAELVLENFNLICNNGIKELTIVDPSTPDLEDYNFEWRNSIGEVIGNSNTIEVNQPGNYSVSFFKNDEKGDPICPFSQTTNVFIPQDYSLSISTSESCDKGYRDVFVSAGNGNFGTWYYRKKDFNERVFLGSGQGTSFVTADMEGPGDYEIIFVVDNSDNNYCKLEDRIDFSVLPQAELELEIIKGSDNCISNNGEVKITAISDIDYLEILKEGQYYDLYQNLNAGDIFSISDLEAGVYSIKYALGPCGLFLPFVVELSEPNEEMEFSVVEIIGETCSEIGKFDGLIRVKMENGPFEGKYKLLSIIGLPFTEDELPNSEGIIDSENGEFEIELPAGQYFLEIIDENGCIYSKPERLIVPAKNQVYFEIPERLTICQVFDFYPYTEQNLRFKIIDPNGNESEIQSGDFFVLDQQGEYTVIGIDNDEVNGLCPRARNIRVTVTEPIEFEPVLRSQDCFGNKTYEAEISISDLSSVKINWYNEKDEIVGNGKFLFPISYGEFKLEVRPINSEVCPNPYKIFTVDKPVFELDIDISIIQYCYPETYSILTVETDFVAAKRLDWILYDQDNKPIMPPQFKDKKEIKVLEFGAYEVVAFSEIGCEIGRKYIEIEKNEVLAEFEVPEELIVCKSYELIPETEFDIIFLVTSPIGEQKEYKKGDPIILDQSGTYTFESMEDSGNSSSCRVIKTLDIIIVQPVAFEPRQVSQDCEGAFIYEADILGTDPESVDFYWYNPEGELIGQEQNIELKAYGTFSLEVRPKGALPCSDPPKTFEVLEPITELEVKLTATPLCPDIEFSVISIETQFEFVNSIEWYFTGVDGQRERQPLLQNERDIAVDIEGTYEVEVLNQLGCVLGADWVLVLRSTDEVRPKTEEEYIVCEYLGKGEIIDPGNFMAYDWYLGNSLVSNEKTFQPTKEGNYTLIVTSDEGCQYTTSFIVVENCSFEVMFPNAIDPQNPEKNFVIYTNYLVDEVSVWIYNKWGELLFYCHNENLIENQQSCIWDGIFNGEEIQIGSYAIKIQYKNKNDEGIKSIFGNLSVLN
jgi:hypothetical protein